MADKDDDLIVNVDDLDTVQVEVDPDAALVEPKTPKEEVQAAKEPKPRTRVRVSPEPDLHDKALADAQAFAKQQEDARKAADATAANERTQREQAQRDAAAARQEAAQYRESATNNELAIIENGISSATTQIESLQEEYTRAAEAGEFAKMGQIQTKLSKAAAALDRLENSKANFDVRKTETTEGRVEAPTVQPNVVEQYLSQFSPAAQNWLRQHPECMDTRVGGDTAKNSMMMAGHWAAKAKHLAEGTPEYFKVIEEHIGTPATVTEEDAPVSRAATVKAADAPQRRAQPSAPPSRDTAAANGQQPRNIREVRLSKEQQEMAKVSFPHLPENQAFGQYARNLIELEAEGKIGRMTH